MHSDHLTRSAIRYFISRCGSRFEIGLALQPDVHFKKNLFARRLIAAAIVESR